MNRTVEPYLHGLRGWRDVTRDATRGPRVIQFRIDLRSFAFWLSAKLHPRFGKLGEDSFIVVLRGIFRVWEVVFLTLVLQIGKAPSMASDFHRVTLLGWLANLLAVPLTGILVPAGFVLLVLEISQASWAHGWPFRFGF